jgi:hypothetical protein
MGVSLYASDNDEIVPDFDSRRPPVWWQDRPALVGLTESLFMLTDQSCVGKRITSLDEREPLIIVDGPEARSMFGPALIYRAVDGAPSINLLSAEKAIDEGRIEKREIDAEKRLPNVEGAHRG